jgi:hypothetical protein
LRITTKYTQRLNRERERNVRSAAQRDEGYGIKSTRASREIRGERIGVDEPAEPFADRRTESDD